ncbi:hypothetical protein MTYM_01514 [Methylococcales bacterium]|nr:hypothetical protein MTYM_01514 [Methylococcales bacterium]
MKKLKNTKNLLILLLMPVLALYLSACSESSVEENQTDDEYIKEVLVNGYSNPNAEEDDLMRGEAGDLDDGGPVGDYGDTPIDSLMKWGRRVTGTSVTVTITSEGDSIKVADITRTITGNFMIVGMVNGIVDTIAKPYTEVLHRKAIFKRVDRSPRPRHNWRLYKVSMVDGGTTAPQNSNDYVQMQQLEVYKNGNLLYTFTGPDFTQNIFTTRRFNGPGIPEVNVGDQIRIVVNTYSTQSEQDIVAWHWGKRNFGFHREPFAMTSQTPNGSGWNRVFEKTFTIANMHHRGHFNGFISASTRKSLYDDSPVEFASDLVGTPYRVLP